MPNPLHINHPCTENCAINIRNWTDLNKYFMKQPSPRVFGAVGAMCLHLNVLSRNLSLLVALEYFARSSMFKPEECSRLWNYLLMMKTWSKWDSLPYIVELKGIWVGAGSESVKCCWSRKKASVQWLANKWAKNLKVNNNSLYKWSGSTKHIPAEAMQNFLG